MLSRTIYINIGLTLLCAFMTIRACQVWRHDPIQAVAPPPVEKPAVTDRNPEAEALKETLPPKSSFQEMVTKNLFSPDRKEDKQTTAIETDGTPEPVREAPRIAGQKIVLHGIIAFEGYRKALIGGDIARQPDDKPTRWIQAGERIGDFTVELINADSMILNDGGKKYKVLLYDEEKTREKTARTENRAAQPAVVSTAASETPEKKKQTPEAQGEQVSPKQNSSEDPYETIDTPFGKIKRKKQ